MEKPLGLIPHHNERRDKLLKGCLDKILNGKKPGVVEQFRVGLQSRSVKPTYVAIYEVCGYMKYLKADPLVRGVLITGSLLAVLHNRAMGGKLEKITQLPDKEKNELTIGIPVKSFFPTKWGENFDRKVENESVFPANKVSN